jgi:hypothetical protein
LAIICFGEKKAELSESGSLSQSVPGELPLPCLSIPIPVPIAMRFSKYRQLPELAKFQMRLS